MKIVIINGSARKGNTLTAINAFIKGASEKNEIEIIERQYGLLSRHFCTQICSEKLLDGGV